jgi:dTDP-glucose pyrophosphorylase
MYNFNEIILKKSASIIDTLVAIDRGGCKTAFLADGDGKLYASVSDGDIRRALIQGEELSACVGCVANKKPLAIKQGYEIGVVREMLHAKMLTAVPVVDNDDVIIDILRINDLVAGPVQTPVVIMAGGLGKRLGRLCEEMPKPMLRIAGEPILQHIISNLTRIGFKNFIISVNHKSDVIENYFGDGSNFGCRINYIREPKRLGTAGSIRLLEGRVNTEFLVVNGDILTRANLMNMLDYHKQNAFDMTVGTVEHVVHVDYGVLEVDGGVVRALKEKPVMNYKINGGVYCLNPQMIERIPKDEYFEMTQLLDMPITVGSYDINDYWIDIGRVKQYETAERDFNNIFGA